MTLKTRATRRDFLRITFTTAGSLLIGTQLVACAPDGTPLPATSAPAAASQTGPAAPPFEPNVFVRIDSDGLATLTIHRSEMGQGVRTALAMILADELGADWDRVRIEQAPSSQKYGSQLTGGSGSIRDHYLPLRRAAATARELLKAAAAQQWGVDAATCSASQGEIAHPESGRTAGFGSLIETAKSVKLVGPAKLKDAKDFTLIGTSIPRVDDPDIVTGRAVYGLDARPPGALVASVERPPVLGAGLVSVDSSAAEQVAGVRQILTVSSGVAVLADNTWAALKGRAALNVTWNEGGGAVWSSDAIRQQLLELANGAAILEPTGGLSLNAIYETPYLAHAAMEPVNCFADVRADSCEIWAATQNPQDVQRFVEQKIGKPTTVYVTLLGGGFGRRLEVDYAVEAAEISQAAGAPVQVVWTREDDTRHDFYRQPTAHWMRATWGADGAIQSWRHFVAGPGFNGVAYRDGSSVLEIGLNAPYQFPDKISQPVLANIPLPTGPWRAVMSGPNAFAIECFFDEVAAQLGQDPYQLRLALLSDNDTLRAPLEQVAARGNWGTSVEAGKGRGIACHTYNDTSVAMVADVAVVDGRVRVEKIVCAIDCGIVIHPDMVVQQMEGGIAFGLSSLLKNAITFEQGRVQQGNFDTYPIVRMSEMPEVEVIIVPSERPPTGTGEMAVPPVVAAVVNAIAAATGKRIRRLPIQPADLA